MAWPLAAVAVCLTLVVRPPLARAGLRWLDPALIVYVALVALQLVPLPPGFGSGFSRAARGRLSAPSRRARRRAGDDAPAAADGQPRRAPRCRCRRRRSVVLTFWCARGAFARGGVRAGARAVAAHRSGARRVRHRPAHDRAALALLAYSPETSRRRSAPIMNRSDFATWMVMALLLTSGYLIARLHSRPSGAGTPVLSSAS